MLSWIFTSMLIILKGEELCPGHEHCINPHHSTGLIDLTTLGNLLELIHLLDGHHYSQKISEPEQAEMQHTRQEFAEFKTLFCQNHHLVFNFCTQADPKVSFFDLSFLHFASSLVQYKYTMKEFDDTFQPSQLKSAVASHIKADHSHLLAEFLEACKAGNHKNICLDWTGPVFSVRAGGYVQVSDGKFCVDSFLPGI